MPICHPERKYHAKGMCRPCYIGSWKSNNKDRVKGSNAKYRAKNQDSLLKKHRKYNSENRETIVEKSRQARLERPERIAENKHNSYRRHFDKNAKKSRQKKLKYNYGITIDEYNAMYEAQGGVCAICGNPNGEKNLCVDHDHNSGKIRGLLCTDCNVGIGRLRDNLSIIQKAFLYIEKHQQESNG